MLPQLHANVFMTCICIKLFTYVSLWHCTQEKERNCVSYTHKGKTRNILLGKYTNAYLIWALINLLNPSILADDRYRSRYIAMPEP